MFLLLEEEALNAALEIHKDEISSKNGIKTITVWTISYIKKMMLYLNSDH